MRWYQITSLAIVAVLVAVVGESCCWGALHCNDRAQMFRATMASDLRNLVTAQESYFADHRVYTQDLVAAGFQASNHVTVVQHLRPGTPPGWSAVALHSGTTDSCAIFVGGERLEPARREGVPTCTCPFLVDVRAIYSRRFRLCR